MSKRGRWIDENVHAIQQPALNWVNHVGHQLEQAVNALLQQHRKACHADVDLALIQTAELARPGQAAYVGA